MSTPKEKAEELVEKFRQKQFSGCIMCSDSYEDKYNDAKCLALIAVDEILKIRTLTGGWADSHKHLPIDESMKPFWQQVRTEIENL